MGDLQVITLTKSAIFRVMETPKFIAYFRVSTDRQGRSSLGLEAQQQAAKLRGVKLGSPDPKKGSAVRSQVLQDKAQQFAENIQPIIKELQAQGITSYKGFARALNARGVPAANNRQWYGKTMKNLLERIISR